MGATNSKGEYIAFLDSDDLWFPWTLSTYARIIKEIDRPTLIAGTLLYFQRDAELSGLTREPLALEAFADYFASSRCGRYCGTCQMLVRRAALLEVGGFADEKFNAEDHDLVMRLGTAPGFVFVTAPAMIGYRQHTEAVTRDVSKTFTGLVHMVQMEKAGLYPGGKGRRREPPADSRATCSTLDRGFATRERISKGLGHLPSNFRLEPCPGKVALSRGVFCQGSVKLVLIRACEEGWQQRHENTCSAR